MSGRSLLYSVLTMLAAAAVFITNPTNVHTEFGNGGGRWPDAVDSFSEYLVRNTVVHRVLGRTHSGFLIVVRGQSRGDYSYTPDSATLYFTSLGGQARALLGIARVAGVNTEAGAQLLADRARIACAVLLAFVVPAALIVTTRPRRLAQYAAIVILVGLSGGLVAFAQNLFWTTFVYFLPLLAIATTYRGTLTPRVIAAFAAAVLVTLMPHYEFWIVYVLVACIPLAVSDQPDRVVVRQAAVLSGVAGVVLLATLGTHVLLVAAETDRSAHDAAAIIANTVRHRNASVSDVPRPMSAAAFQTVAVRQRTQPGIVIPGAPRDISNFDLWLAVLAVLLWTRRHPDRRVVRVLLLSFLAYASWYVLGYQHVMYHQPYDRLLFASTIQLGLCVAVVVALRQRNPADDLPRNHASTDPASSSSTVERLSAGDLLVDTRNRDLSENSGFSRSV